MQHLPLPLPKSYQCHHHVLPKHLALILHLSKAQRPEVVGLIEVATTCSEPSNKLFWSSWPRPDSGDPCLCEMIGRVSELSNWPRSNQLGHPIGVWRNH